MSEQNVGLVRTALGPFLETGEPRWDLLHEEIEIRDHDIMDAGEYRGHPGLRRWVEDWAAAWSEFTVEPAREWIDAGEEVVLVYRVKATGRASGVAVERQDAMVCRVKDAQIVRIDYYNNRAQAGSGRPPAVAPARRGPRLTPRAPPAARRPRRFRAPA